jgi:hypothetical protein
MDTLAGDLLLWLQQSIEGMSGAVIGAAFVLTSVCLLRKRHPAAG